MATISMTGSDTITINDRILADLADGDIATLTFSTDIASLKTGKNGNTIYGLNEAGRQCELSVRLIRGSADDRFMNQLLTAQMTDFATFALLTGSLTKRVGDGLGTVVEDAYILSSGVFVKYPEGKSNVEGDTQQSVAVYTIRFASGPRVIG